MREFLKWMAASAIGTIIGLIAFIAIVGVSAGGFLAVLLATSSRDSEPDVEPSTVLVLDLSTNIQDGVPLSGAGLVLEETLAGSRTESISVYQAIEAINRAAEDDAIAGLYLYGNSSAGFATLRELRQALEAFKAEGKPILAYAVGWSERDYYLTSVADTMLLNPTGLLEFNGFRSETQFLAGALEKYGVGVQVLRVGRYKSAVEPFIRTDNSPEDREQTQALLTDLWQEFLTTVGTSREVPQPQLQQLADRGGLLLAPDALAAGLVTEVAHYDDVLTQLQAITGEEGDVGEDLRSINLTAYSRIDEAKTADAKDVIALVYVAGDIVLGEGGEGLIGSDSLSRTLRELRLDEDVKAVVLRINSPGGGASASEVIADAVRRLDEVKPVVVSMGNVAASGGYMIAAGGREIFASPNTITGSIGVFGLLLNVQELADRNGVTWDVIKTARFADIDTIARPQSPEELALQQAVVNQLYDRFVTLVADGRDLPKAEVESVAQGRVWSGADAQAIGLVDEVGGLEAALASAAAEAELDTWRVEEYPRPKSLEDEIFDRLFGGIEFRLSLQGHPLLTEIHTLQQNWALLQQLNDPNSAYTRLPFTTDVK